jgi:hypothetical protein
MITTQYIAQQLVSYLNHQISFDQLVHWSEQNLLEGGFEPGQETAIREALGRLAAADAEGFGLLWEDCDELMHLLGYKLKIDAAKVA